MSSHGQKNRGASQSSVVSSRASSRKEPPPKKVSSRGRTTSVSPDEVSSLSRSRSTKNRGRSMSVPVTVTKKKGRGDTPREGRADPKLNELKKHQKFQDLCVQWTVSVKVNAKTFFNGVQFITHDKDEEFGSDWQRLICKKCGIPDRHQEEYWNRPKGGKATARKIVNNRKMNVTRRMGEEFKS